MRCVSGLVCLAACLLVVADPSTAGVRPHPRIFLDKAALTRLHATKMPAIRALLERCDGYLEGPIEWPRGKDYPDPGIGEGYQGDGYFSPMLNLGLCYQALRTTTGRRARRYGAKGADLLRKMSAVRGRHGEDPARDSGYGVRFYVSGMAIGYDWLHPLLSKRLRKRVAAAIKTWLRTYERKGFGRQHPQGNYFAGYYAARAYAGLALEGETKHSAAELAGWLRSVHLGRVQPYYAKNLSGGGWPEGWNYGWVGTMNMILPSLAFKTAKGIDLVHGGGAPYAFPLGAARYQVQFAWPDLVTFEDSDAVYDGDNPTATQPWLYFVEAAVLDAVGDKYASVVRDMGAAARAAGASSPFGADWDTWVDALFGGGDRRSYTSEPLSYRATGMDMVAMRSSWDKDAVWAALSGGPYVNNPDNGEEYFDKGSLAIVNGAKPFLVNATAALLRNTPGTSDGSDYYTPVYDDNFGDNRTRGLYNIFYVDRPTPTGQNNRLRSAGARTGLDAFEDRGDGVYLRDTHLEDMYPDQGDPTILGWTRELVYVRPRLFFVFDRTQVTDPSLDQRMAFHLPRAATSAGLGSSRFDAGGMDYAGSVSVVLPSGARTAVAGDLGGTKVVRLDVRPATPGVAQRWLTVFDAASTAAAAAAVTPLSGGDATGALVAATTGNTAVLFSAAGRLGDDIAYDVPAADTTHLLVDAAPGAGYRVATEAAPNGTWHVHLSPGSTVTADANGVLRFTTTAGGLVGVSTPRRTAG